MSRKLRIGFVGWGGQAGWHCNELQSLGLGQVVGAVDINPAARAAFTAKTGQPAFERLEDLQRATGANAVVICTPPTARLEYARAACALGMHQLHEKPLAHDAATARTIADLLDARPELVTAVGYCHRFVPAVARVREWVQAGRFGEVLWMTVRFTGPAPFRDHWMSDPRIGGGGTCLGVSCHSLDLFQHLFGPIRSVQGRLRHVWPGRAEDTDCLLVQSAAGVVGQFISSYSSAAAHAEWEVVGTARWARLDYAGGADVIEHGAPGQPVEREPVASGHGRVRLQDEAWLRAIGGAPRTPLATARESVALGEWVDQVYRAARESAA